MRDALDYMGLAPGKKLTDIAIDRVFIGSCTNARIEDLRAAAAVLAGASARCRAWCRRARPASSARRRRKASTGSSATPGLEWADSGCSMCVGINGDLVAAGERCASTTNRNFRGRQGRRRAHASDVAGDGRRRRGQRPSGRCPAAARRAQATEETAMEKFIRTHRDGLSAPGREYRHRPDPAGALS